MVERGGLWLLATPGKQELWTCEHDGDLLSKKKLESKKYLGIHSSRYSIPACVPTANHVVFYSGEYSFVADWFLFS